MRVRVHEAACLVCIKPPAYKVFLTFTGHGEPHFSEPVWFNSMYISVHPHP